MAHIRTVTTYLRHFGTSKLLLTSLFVLAIAGVLAVTSVTGMTGVRAANCSTNDIINCGVSGVSDFVAKYHRNTTGDLPAVYAHYGLSPSDVDRFERTAVNGIAYKNGEIRVNGKVVATGGFSVGRNHKPGDQPVNIQVGGQTKTYWQGSNQTAFAGDSIPALVMMNGDQFEFAVLTTCANAQQGHPTGKAPSFACNMLSVTPKTGTTNTFTFTASASVTGGAKIDHYVYEFGDGSQQTSTATSVSHTYARSGNFTAKVTVFVKVNGETKSISSAHCSKPVMVSPKAAFTCTALTFTQLERNKYRFIATSSASGGAKLKNADFDFGDGQTAQNIQPSSATEVTIEHTFAADKSYTIVATV